MRVKNTMRALRSNRNTVRRELLHYSKPFLNYCKNTQLKSVQYSSIAIGSFCAHIVSTEISEAVCTYINLRRRLTSDICSLSLVLLLSGWTSELLGLLQYSQLHAWTFLRNTHNLLQDRILDLFTLMWLSFPLFSYMRRSHMIWMSFFWIHSVGRFKQVKEDIFKWVCSFRGDVLLFSKNLINIHNQF